MIFLVSNKTHLKMTKKSYIIVHGFYIIYVSKMSKWLYDSDLGGVLYPSKVELSQGLPECLPFHPAEPPTSLIREPKHKK
jgi:hypothetical protein